MTWSLYRWVWRLKSPLHIGRQPAGALNRTRLYIPAHTLWGAVTAELARLKANSFPDYEKIGEKIKENVRFTYLYPAEKVGNDWRAWLPIYEEGKGLVWSREDRNKNQEILPDRDFRMRLLSTRPGTAIDPSSDSVLEGTLREMEVINPYWRINDTQEIKPVAMVGYVFFKDKAMEELFKDFQGLHFLIIGGDTRYGFGHLERAGKLQESSKVFDFNCKTTSEDPIIETDRLLAHGDLKDRRSLRIIGQYELIASWNYGTLQPKNILLWAPGSREENKKVVPWRIDKEGFWYPELQ